MDEEYFRAVYLFSDAGVTQTGKQLWSQAQHRAYIKNAGLHRAIRQILKPVHVFTPSGLWAGERMAVELDHARLDNVARMTIRGLFYFETDQSLNTDTWIDVMPLLTPAAFSEMQQPGIQVTKGKRDWPGIFEYRLALSNDVLQGSMWFIRFFGQICYCGITAPQEMVELETL